MAGRPEMFGPTSEFSGMADSMELWKNVVGPTLVVMATKFAHNGDPVAYRLVSLVFSLLLVYKPRCPWFKLCMIAGSCAHIDRRLDDISHLAVTCSQQQPVYRVLYSECFVWTVDRQLPVSRKGVAINRYNVGRHTTEPCIPYHKTLVIHIPHCVHNQTDLHNNTSLFEYTFLRF